MIFAAGRGTRMAPLTDTLPKPLIPVGGRPLLDHALDLADGIETVVVNTHYLAPMVEHHLRGRAVITLHEPELLETGGGLRNALPLLGDGPVLTLNSDAIWQGPNVLGELVGAWDGTRMEALVSVVDRDRAVGHTRAGDFLLDIDGRATRGPGPVYTGAQIVSPDRLRNWPEHTFSMNVIWDQMIAEGTLYGLPYPGRWCDVGQPSSIPLAEAMLDV